MREGYDKKPMAVYRAEQPKLTYQHANNLVKFGNESSITFNKELNFSFMHAIFAVVLEVKSFKKFLRNPPYQLRLYFNQKGHDAELTKHSTNELMASFIR